MSTELIPFNDLKSMAVAISNGGLFPALKNEGQVLSLMLLAQAEGLHPMNAMRQFHIIDGKPSMRSDAMLAKYRQKGGKVEWKTRADDASAQIGLWSFEGQTLEVGFTFKEAQAANYVRAGSGWSKDAPAMMRARAISRAVRMLAPEVVVGLYTPEEVEDFGTDAPAPTKSKGGKAAPEQVTATVVSSEPLASAQAAALPLKEQPAAASEPEPQDAAGRLKFIRGKLNQALLKVVDSPKEFQAIRIELNKTHGKEFEKELTGVRPNETFESLLTEHWKRIGHAANQRKFQSDVGSTFDVAQFRKLEQVFFDGHVDQSKENEAAINAKGAALKLPEYTAGATSPSADAAAAGEEDPNAAMEG